MISKSNSPLNWIYLCQGPLLPSTSIYLIKMFEKKRIGNFHSVQYYIWYRKVIVSYILSNFKFVCWSRITPHEVYWRFDILAYPEISSNAIWIHMQITNALLLVQIRKSLCVWFPIDHGFDTTLSRYNNILECVISTSVDRISIAKSMASDKS